MTTDADANAVLDAVIGESARFGAKRLYRDALSMASSTVATAGLGMVFWAVAASMFPPAQLGVMTAVLSVIVTTSMVVSSGIGDAYSALLPAVGAARPRVFQRGQRIFFALTLITGLAAAVAITVLPTNVHGSLAVAVLVVAGTISWSAFILQSAILTSLGRARLLPLTNGIMGVAKVVLLPVLAATVKWHTVELAFIVAGALGFLALHPLIGRIIESGKELPAASTMTEAQALGEFNSLVIRTLASTALSLGVLTLAPFMVTAFAGPIQGALFALSLSIVQMLDLVGAALAVSLVVHGSGTPDETATMARSILIRGLLLISVGGVLITAAAPLALRLLDAQYGSMGATAVIGALCAGSFIRVVYVVWSAVQRARRKMKALLTLNFISASAFVLIMPVMCHTYGAFGGALAVLVGQLLLSGGATVHFALQNRRIIAMPCDPPPSSPS